MKLRDLNPQLDGTVAAGHLTFNCPAGHAHTIRVPVSTSGGSGAWKAIGAFPDSLTLTPSVMSHNGAPTDDTLSDGQHSEEYAAAAKCGWHGFVTDGEVTNA